MFDTFIHVMESVLVVACTAAKIVYGGLVVE